jgi:hypothetical protein
MYTTVIVNSGFFEKIMADEGEYNEACEERGHFGLK